MGDGNDAETVQVAQNGGNTATSLGLSVLFCVLIAVVMFFGVWCFCKKSGKWNNYKMRKTHIMINDEEEFDDEELTIEDCSIEIDMDEGGVINEDNNDEQSTLNAHNHGL